MKSLQHQRPVIVIAAIISLSLSVSDASGQEPSITISSPQAGQTLIVGDTVWLDWDVQNLGLDMVLIIVTYDGWTTDEWLTIDDGLPASNPEWKHYPVVPDKVTDEFYIKVGWYNNVNNPADIEGPFSVVSSVSVAKDKLPAVQMSVVDQRQSATALILNRADFIAGRKYFNVLGKSASRVTAKGLRTPGVHGMYVILHE
ncbi:MAG: hypothetical protein GF398_05880 [Chitinivibrionales bacterium]|nr:hypothetical protein [Chitinivibrionales bacterium]